MKTILMLMLAPNSPGKLPILERLPILARPIRFWKGVLQRVEFSNLITNSSRECLFYVWKEREIWKHKQDLIYKKTIFREVNGYF